MRISRGLTLRVPCSSLSQNIIVCSEIVCSERDLHSTANHERVSIDYLAWGLQDDDFRD
jgi:hypothetical protein